jgi:TonB family protein
LILDKGGDVNAEADFGSTPLDMAIAIDSKEIVELFRRHGGRVGSGVLIFDIDKPPEALVMPMPRITEKARIARIDPGFGSMKLQFIIRKDGTVDNIKVIKALGYGMEESAIKTIGKWRFKPATLNGNPIDVGVNYEMRCDVF